MGDIHKNKYDLIQNSQPKPERIEGLVLNQVNEIQKMK